MNLHNASANTNQLLKGRLHLFAEYKNLPESLKQKMLQSFEFHFHRSYFNEKLILNTISGQLKRV